jgi:N-acyl-D-amino-acid deacylase
LRIIAGYREKGAKIQVDTGMYTAFTTVAWSPGFDEKLFLDDESQLKKLRAATGKYAGQYLSREQYLEMRRDYPEEFLIYDRGDINDVLTAFSLPDAMVSTDCLVHPDGQGHPQNAATYPYFFRLLVKETNRLTLHEAVRRCSLLPAKAAGLESKGRIAPGMDADLAVLDWERLREHADFPGIGDPGAPPSGVKHVFVNGKHSIKNEKKVQGVHTGFNIKR